VHMHIVPKCSYQSLALFASIVGWGGCSTEKAPIPEMSVTNLPTLGALTEGSSGIQTRNRAGQHSIEAPTGPLAWMIIGEFYPPGCKRIVPQNYRGEALTRTPRASFPSMEQCESPNGRWFLSHLGNERADGIDYVVLLGPVGLKPTPLFVTRVAMDVLWSPDSRYVAVTIFSGHNRSSVFLIRVADRKISKEASPTLLISNYLPSVEPEAPQFVMARGWTQRGDLLIRGRGQELLEPFTVFGYEAVVRPQNVDRDLVLRFSRAFTLGGKAPGYSRNQ
jgi:hypothetical protein